MKRIISLQKIGFVDQLILIKLKKNLKWAFKKYPVEISINQTELELLQSEYVSTRQQYNGDLILNRLRNYEKTTKFFRVFGIIDKDIYSKYLNFVFGIAIIPKNKNRGVALISLSRLRETFYRRDEDNALFELRILRETIHELGHSFGLYHCKFECVMQFSNSLMEADNKPLNFCVKCEKKLDHYFNL